MPRAICKLALCLATLMGVVAARSTLAEDLHAGIDRLISAAAGGEVAPPADDAEFLRRVWLDLAGTIPTAADARAFLADSAPDKRTKLIDRLLGGPDYPRRMEQAVSVMLLERRPGTNVPDAEWSEFLQKSFAANKPWNQLVREIVAADGRDPATRAGIRFFVDGRTDTHVATQDVARLFLGMNIQCAQCHDHPVVDEYEQADYYGLYSFLRAGKLHTEAASKKAFLVEDPLMMKSEFVSVFFPDDKGLVGPRLPGRTEIEIPLFEKGQELAETAANGFPGVPKFRPRQLLAEQLTAADNARFVRNSVNRLWFLMMGRGLVHPLDLHHANNAPSHPELLDLLAAEFVARQFDVKHLLREIALSAAYQRASRLPADVTPETAVRTSYRSANAKPLSSEQMLFGQLRAVGLFEQTVARGATPDPKFNYNDYINGRIANPPQTLPDLLKLYSAVFGSPPGEAEVEFSPSMGQALFLMNERLVLSWLIPRDGNLIARLAGEKDDAKVVEELYLSVLTRLPDDAERMEGITYLADQAARRDGAIGDLAWALLSATEFRLNH